MGFCQEDDTQLQRGTSDRPFWEKGLGDVDAPRLPLGGQVCKTGMHYKRPLLGQDGLQNESRFSGSNRFPGGKRLAVKVGF